MNTSQLPYKILVLAPFSSVPEDKFKPVFFPVDLYSIDETIEKMSPVLYFPLSTEISSKGAVTLKFNAIKDFKPKSILKNNSYLSSLSSREGDTKVAFADKEQVLSKEKETTPIDDILSMVETPDNSKGDGSKTNDLSDSKISTILRELFSTSEFQRTESAWRGLQTLLKKADIKGFMDISVQIASISPNSLEHVLNEITQLPENEIPNLLIIDLGLDNTTPSIELFNKITEFADQMMLPTCAWIKPEFFRIGNYDEFHKISYLKTYLDDASYAKFRKLGSHAGASWSIITCNSFAVRPENEFEEQPPFISPVWAIGTLIAMSVKNSGWPMGFTRYNTKRLENLAMVDSDGTNLSSTQALFSEDRIMQFIDEGITPIVGFKNKDSLIVPKEASLTGESIKFQLFMNRIIELLIHLKKNVMSDDSIEEKISSEIEDIFIQTGHPSPDDVKVIRDTNSIDSQKVFDISFTPSESVISGLGKIEFSFAW